MMNIERTLIVRKRLLFSIEQQRENISHAEVDIREIGLDRHDDDGDEDPRESKTGPLKGCWVCVAPESVLKSFTLSTCNSSQMHSICVAEMVSAKQRSRRRYGLVLFVEC